MEKLDGLAPLFLYFIIYAFIGYVVEVIYCSIEEKKIVNRGFLFGPILPVYGLAMVLMIIFTRNIKDNIFLLFFSSMIICTVLEYFTSWLLENLVGIRWWDYSKTQKLNINGRVSALTSLSFGLISTVVTYWVHPQVVQFVASLEPHVEEIALVLSGILLLDIFASSYAVGAIKDRKELRRIDGDQTNEIKRLARSAIAQFITGKNRINTRFEETKKQIQKTQQQIKQTQKDIKKKISKIAH